MKRDLVIFKPTGKIVIIHPNMSQKDGIVRLHNSATPGFQNSPFVNPYEHTFRVEMDYELIKGVELPEGETLQADILANKERYSYNKATKQFVLIDTYRGAGYDRAIADLTAKVKELETKE